MTTLEKQQVTANNTHVVLHLLDLTTLAAPAKLALWTLNSGTYRHHQLQRTEICKKNLPPVHLVASRITSYSSNASLGAFSMFSVDIP